MQFNTNKIEALRSIGFGKHVDAVEENKCPFCGIKIELNSFKDALSEKEYRISGLCQGCQDKMFGG